MKFTTASLLVLWAVTLYLDLFHPDQKSLLIAATIGLVLCSVNLWIRLRRR